MARATTETLLPLDSWARILGIDPWEFNQVGTGFPRPRGAQCNTVFFQWPWQVDFLGREELAQTLAEAEAVIAQQLRYWPAPKYFANEIVQYPRPYDTRSRGFAGTPRHDWKPVQLFWHKVVGGGLFTRTSIGTTANLTRADNDGDGVKETFTCSIATTVTDVNEIGVYVQAADRMGEPVGETWRLRPVTVSLSGGTATITGHASLLVKPALTSIDNPAILNVTDNSIYVTQVEVYRVYRDDTATDATPSQGVAEWDARPEVQPDAVFSVKAISLGEHQNDIGMPIAAFGDPSSWPYWWQPDRLSVNYLAGLPLVNGQMETHMARIVAYLATALLPTEKCGCERSNRIVYYWRQLVNSGEAEKRPITIKEIEANPFGEPRRGALWAWKQIQPLKDGEAVGL